MIKIIHRKDDFTVFFRDDRGYICGITLVQPYNENTFAQIVSHLPPCPDVPL